MKLDIDLSILPSAARLTVPCAVVRFDTKRILASVDLYLDVCECFLAVGGLDRFEPDLTSVP